MLLRLLSRTTRRISFHPLVLGLTFAYFFFNVLRNILLLLSFSNVQDPQLGHCTFSIAYFSMASKATSIACCCISSVCHESQACRRYNAGEVCATMSADLTCALIVVSTALKIEIWVYDTLEFVLFLGRPCTRFVVHLRS